LHTWAEVEAALRASGPDAHRRLGLAWLSLTTVLSRAGDGGEAERLMEGRGFFGKIVILP